MKTNKMTNKRGRITALVALGSLVFVRTSLAGVTVDTYERAKAFAPQAQLSANARAIELTLVTEPGPPCDRGMTEQIEVMVIQESTGAVGTGILTTSCGVDSVAPLVTAHAVQGSAGFKAGAATAFAFRAARQNGKVLVQTPNSLSPASPRPGRM